MHLNNILYKIIEPFGDPKEFFWCTELAKERGSNTINLTFLCNNDNVLTVELKIIPYYELVLGVTAHIPSTIEASDLANFLTTIKKHDWEIEIDSNGVHISTSKDVKEFLEYLVVILKERCNKKHMSYTCSIGDE